MEYVKNPCTGEVRYCTTNWAKWLKSWGWRKASFEDHLNYQMRLYWLRDVSACEASSSKRRIEIT